MSAATEEGGGEWQQGKGLTQTQRMTINAALRNATMQTEGLASVMRTLVDAIDIRIHRTRSFVAVWDKECGRFIKLATPVSEAAIDLVREPVEKGGQRSKVIDEVLKQAANAFAGWVQWEVDRITRNSKEDHAAVVVEELASQASGTDGGAVERSRKRFKKDHNYLFTNEEGSVVPYNLSHLNRNRTEFTAECRLKPWFQKLVFQAAEGDGDFDLLNGTISLGPNSVLTAEEGHLFLRPRRDDDALLLSCDHDIFDRYAVRGEGALEALVARWKAWDAAQGADNLELGPYPTMEPTSEEDVIAEAQLFWRVRRLRLFLGAAIEKAHVRNYLLYLLFERLVLAVPKECVVFEAAAGKGKTMFLNFLRVGVGSYAEKRSEDSIRATGTNKTARSLDDDLALARVRFFAHDEAPSIDEQYLLTSTNGSSKSVAMLHSYEQREITMFPMRFITKNPMTMNSPIANCNKDLRCKINLFDDAVLSLPEATSYRDLAKTLEAEATGHGTPGETYGPAAMLLLCEAYLNAGGTRPPRPTELYPAPASSSAPTAGGSTGEYANAFRRMSRAIFGELFEPSTNKLEYLTMKQVGWAMSKHAGMPVYETARHHDLATNILMAGMPFEGDGLQIPKLLGKAPSDGTGQSRKNNVMRVAFKTDALRAQLFVQD